MNLVNLDSEFAFDSLYLIKMLLSDMWDEEEHSAKESYG